MNRIELWDIAREEMKSFEGQIDRGQLVAIYYAFIHRIIEGESIDNFTLTIEDKEL